MTTATLVLSQWHQSNDSNVSLSGEQIRIAYSCLLFWSKHIRSDASPHSINIQGFICKMLHRKHAKFDLTIISQMHTLRSNLSIHTLYKLGPQQITFPHVRDACKHGFSAIQHSLKHKSGQRICKSCLAWMTTHVVLKRGFTNCKTKWRYSEKIDVQLGKCPKQTYQGSHASRAGISNPAPTHLSIIKAIVHPKMKYVISYSPSCRSKPVRPSFIFG